MNLTYDSNVDTLHVRFVDAPAAKQEEVTKGVVIHLDGEGRIVEIELRNARDRLSKDVALPGPPR
jgi:uncharacterized protein YuzE